MAEDSRHRILISRFNGEELRVGFPMLPCARCHARSVFCKLIAPGGDQHTHVMRSLFRSLSVKRFLERNFPKRSLH